jgi:hypothetical protein
MKKPSFEFAKGLLLADTALQPSEISKQRALLLERLARVEAREKRGRAIALSGYVVVLLAFATLCSIVVDRVDFGGWSESAVWFTQAALMLVPLIALIWMAVYYLRYQRELRSVQAETQRTALTELSLQIKLLREELDKAGRNQNGELDKKQQNAHKEYGFASQKVLFALAALFLVVVGIVGTKFRSDRAGKQVSSEVRSNVSSSKSEVSGPSRIERASLPLAPQFERTSLLQGSPSAPHSPAEPPERVAQEEPRDDSSATKGESALFKMLSDPQARKLLEHQQGMVLDLTFAPLYESLQLSAHERREFRNALVNHQMSNMMEASGIDASETAAQTSEGQTALETHLKQILGEEKFAKYQEFTATLSDRIMLDQLSRETGLSSGVIKSG